MKKINTNSKKKHNSPSQRRLYPFRYYTNIYKGAYLLKFEAYNECRTLHVCKFIFHY